ncbi:hypothetical protein ACFL6I_24920 [candidate division KSB1 bacterium]
MKVLFCRITLIVFIIIISPVYIFGQNVLWWSNIPPQSKKNKVITYGMHKLSSMRGEKGKSQIIQWLRNGNNINHSIFLSQQPENSEIILFDPDGKETEISLNTRDKDLSILYTGEMEGFYNLYLLNQSVRNDTLFVLAAKAERLCHSCRNGHKEVHIKIPYETYPERIPFEILRERFFQEDFHFFISSGDEVTFQVLLNGQPVDHAEVRMITEKDWSVKKYTDKNGQISQEMIGDFFSRIKEFHKDELHNFLIIASCNITSAGVFQGKPYEYIHYTATYTDSYKPAVYQYSSFVYGIFSVLIVVAVSLVIIKIYRNRKEDPKFWRGAHE